jgi:23S rRNA pseudouridine2605 synthase
MRLNQFLSQAGVCSRRAADQLISRGAITVNRRPAVLGQQIDPQVDHVIYQGQEVVLKHKFLYYILNKPKNVLSTTSDDRGRPTVLDYIKIPTRLYPIGRLDFASTGLILLTNDGDLTLRLTHPRYHLSKTYLVDIDKPLTSSHLNQIASGLYLDNQKTLPLKIVSNHGSSTNFIITLHQGLNRQIRRMFEQLGYQVLRLHRIAVGPISLGDLKPGECRPLSSLELKSLQK